MLSDSGGKKASAKALEDQFLYELIDSSEHILFRVDFVRGGFDYISPAVSALYGISPDELYRHGLRVLMKNNFDPRGFDRFQTHVLELCRTTPGQQVRTTIEYQLTNVDGQAVLYSSSMSVVSDATGKPLSASGVAVDITAKRMSEVALRESEGKYRATMDSLQVGVFMLQDSKFRFVNHMFCAMFGYSEGECIDRLGPLDLVIPEEHDRVFEHMNRRVAGIRDLPYEVVALRKDGSRFPLKILGEPSVLNGRPASVGTVIDISRERKAEQALKDSTRRYATLFEGAQDAIVVVDAATGMVVSANVAAELLFRYPHEDMMCMTLRQLQPIESTSLSAALPFGAYGSNGPLEAEVFSADGEVIAVEISTNIIETSEGQQLIQRVYRDIRQRKLDEIELKRAARVFEASQEAILLTDAERKIVLVNTAFLEMTGYRAMDVIGKNPRLLKSGRHTNAFYETMWAAINKHDKWQGEVWNRRSNGEVFPVWLRVSVYRDEAGKIRNYVGVSTDISERLASQEKIRQLAYYDSLTGLPNRRLLQDRVGQMLASAEREKKQFALLFIDLDHFKKVNDSLGHSVGDKLLTEVAERLSGCVRRMDTVARIGGDEFVVLLSDVALDGAAEVSRKILSALGLPCHVDQHELAVTPSLGISVYPQDGVDFETLLKHADIAMYRAKESGRNAYQFFASEMNEAALERLLLENSLRQAIERAEFVLYYQAKVDLEHGKIVGAEALIRWQHPKLGLVAPDKFIPVAEQCGLIVPLGDWVLHEACRQNQAWQSAGLPAISVAVNISSVQFRNGQLDASVSRALSESGMAPEFLEVELTEGVVMGCAEETIAALHRLSAMGVQIAIDDFGTGYSSLSYLKHFPIDRLKIDKSFVRDIVSDPDDCAIATAVIRLGHSLRLMVNAEGVEHPEQLELLRQQGCDEFQGYHFSKPLPADEFAELLRKEGFTGS